MGQSGGKRKPSCVGTDTMKRGGGALRALAPTASTSIASHDGSWKQLSARWAGRSSGYKTFHSAVSAESGRQANAADGGRGILHHACPAQGRPVSGLMKRPNLQSNPTPSPLIPPFTTNNPQNSGPSPASPLPYPPTRIPTEPPMTPRTAIELLTATLSALTLRAAPAFAQD